MSVLKIKNTETNNFETVPYLIGEDSLPIGSIIEYDGNVIPNGYEEVAAIIESGSNSGGSYTKWDNGFMICTKKITTTITMEDTYGGAWYQASVNLGDFPVSFVSPPDYLNVNNNGIPIAVPEYVNSSTSWGNARILYPTKLTNYAVNLRATAIGKWK